MCIYTYPPTTGIYLLYTNQKSDLAPKPMYSVIVSCSHLSSTHPFFFKFENDLNYDHALSCRCLGLCLVGNLRKCSAPSWVVDTRPRLVWTGPYLKDKFAKLEIN